MESFNKRVQQYQQRFGLKNHQSSFSLSAGCRLCIVIPCFDEEPEHTIQSLSACTSVENTEVILVFNHSESAEERIKEKHQRQLQTYKYQKLKNGLVVQSMAAFDLPKKHAGVGLARKIGMDAALYAFAEINYDGLIVCLDADCTVSINYVEVLKSAEAKAINGCSIYFEHPIDELSDFKEQAILNYEVFLRAYVHALRASGYPNAFHTVGSSMAVRASIYAKIGGMNKRKAGEDFYFLHKLIPQGAFYDVTDATVYPSSRISYRVPFGTGRAMSEIEQGTKDFSHFYNHKIFVHLKEFHDDLKSFFETGMVGHEIMKDFFMQQNLLSELDGLRSRSVHYEQFLRNFSFWWDGFKVLKFVHHFKENKYKNEDVLANAIKMYHQTFDTLSSYVTYLRLKDRNSDFKLK